MVTEPLEKSARFAPYAIAFTINTLLLELANLGCSTAPSQLQGSSLQNGMGIPSRPVLQPPPDLVT